MKISYPQNKDLFQTFIDYLCDLFFPPLPLKKKISGKLVVSGKGFSEFTFKNNFEDVFVYFNDIDPDTVPCDPGSDDCLDWKIVCHKHHCQLIIEWNVSQTRTIVWNVY